MKLTRGKCQFKIGDTVVFEPLNFNPAYWNATTEKERIKYYGDLGYGSDKLVLFTFICVHKPQDHCVLINMDNQKVETMRHWEDFRLVTDEEC